MPSRVTHLLDECQRPADSYDLLGGLFVEMNTPGKTPGGRYKGVNYFNGCLFAEPARIELDYDELQPLRVTTTKDWSKGSGGFAFLEFRSLQCDKVLAAETRRYMSSESGLPRRPGVSGTLRSVFLGRMSVV